MNFPDIIYPNDNYMDILRATGNNENIIYKLKQITRVNSKKTKTSVQTNQR